MNPTLPRPNLRLLPPWDQSQGLRPAIRPVEWYEVPLRDDPPMPQSLVRWEQGLSWALVVVGCLFAWYGLLALLFWCCA